MHAPIREFITVARVGEIPPGHGRPATVHGRWIAIFNVGGSYYAIDNLCLHRGGPLAEGVLTGCVVTCPWHGWQFDVRNGTMIQDPGTGVPAHETRVSGDEVQVRLRD